MRILFLMLVLANLAFASWHAWFSEPALPTRPVHTGAPTIELFTDADAGTNGVDSVPPQTAANPDDSVQLRACVSVGPFPNRVDVEDAIAALTASGFAADRRTAPGEVWLGYWVYLDAIATQAQAAIIVGQLSEAGIDEAYVIADGNNGNIVSLGVFSERSRAQQRFTEVQALEFAPVIANRSQPGEVFWLDVTARDDRSFNQSELPRIEVDPEPRFMPCIDTSE